MKNTLNAKFDIFMSEKTTDSKVNIEARHKREYYNLLEIENTEYTWGHNVPHPYISTHDDYDY